MDESSCKRVNGGCGSSSSSSRSMEAGSESEDYEIWECVIPYVVEPRDRAAVSLVCKRWCQIDALTRKHVTIALCYSATPQRLWRRFPQLESLKLKGKPRAAMFNLIAEDWGGYVTPWVEEVIRSFKKMKALHFRRMIVKDSDLELLAKSAAGSVFEVLKLDKCSGFSTDGLLHVGRFCRKLRTLDIEESLITENDGEWLHQLALNNTVLENLNFYTTDLSTVTWNDIELIARRCPSLKSVKISDCDISDIIGFFGAATSLEEFGGGSFSENLFDEQKYASVEFPPRLCRLGITYLGNAEVPILHPIASRLQQLDLLYAMLDTEGHCQLLQRCQNLEFLEVRNVIGDRGLEVVARCCKKMKRLRVERAADDQDIEDVEGVVTHRGLISLALGCVELEYLVVYVSDITNAALECIGRYSKNLHDFRLVLLDRMAAITDLPLDNGVRSLLIGCDKLKRFALYLRPGGLTDVGLNYIGQYSPRIQWMLLGYIGESDRGLIDFSRGCPALRKLEMRGCCFSEHALATAARNLTGLRYLWVQGYRSSGNLRDLMPMVRPNWNVELIPARQYLVQDEGRQMVIPVEDPAHILAYYSFAGQRTDYPPSVVPLNMNDLQDS
ncbi:coronatine-insensitive protein 1-like [Andrographis paniculata]|uniref:coronatine-insensitive protein 1-like n=1 Tax=Andrographis paniculata TaxID=175694 RepID=UPI0021E78496|nr:coronatine-insensitive protein 1-like [Andrographis paniculata]